jgi:hypothetical protein
MRFAEFLLIFRERRLLPVYRVIVINMFLVGVLFGFLPVYLYSIGYTVLVVTALAGIGVGTVWTNSDTRVSTMVVLVLWRSQGSASA